MIDAGSLDRRVQFRRSEKVDDGYATAERFQDHGTPVWASRRDVSDAEKASSGTVFAELSARFRVRSSEFTRGLSPTDRLLEGSTEFQIIGIKEIGRRYLLEITAIARMG